MLGFYLILHLLFNTIRPRIVVIVVDELLNHFNLDFVIAGWILDVFNRQDTESQSEWLLVREDVIIYGISSRVRPFTTPLYSLYYTNRHILKLADDSATVSLLYANRNEHGPVINDFVLWCDRAFLQLHVTKIKDMLIDK